MHRRHALAATGVLIALASCQTKEAKTCRTLMEEAQKVVVDVRSSEIDSVKKSLAAVEAAQLACERAGLSREHEELTKAKNQFRGHLDYLERKANEPAQRKLTPAEVERFVKEGDPSCPKGLAYKHGGSGKEIRCTGAQPVDMNFEKAEDYFSGRGYKIHKTDGSNTLKAEYGAELVEYRFASKAEAPKCLVLYPPPGMSWQEAVARVSGVQPRLLKPDGEIPTRRGRVPLRVVEQESKTVVRIGDCG